MRAEMRKIWSEEAKYERWLQVELAVAEAWAQVGRIPQEAVARMRAAARIDITRIEELEMALRHDVLAFTTQVGERLGDDARYLHFGLTSTDVVDTALALAIDASMKSIEASLIEVRKVLRERAAAEADTLMIGRTHGMHAEPTTFGLKLALWFQELGRAEQRIQAAAQEVRVGKFSGAVGTYSHITPEVERLALQRLGLGTVAVSTQVLQRDRHAALMAAVAILGASLEKIALEIRHLQRSEVGEVLEAFGRRQKGSSAMPHKRNPIVSEQICGLARVLRGNLVAALENVALWHERDISHSSVERIILPDSLSLIDYMLDTTGRLLQGLEVQRERMRHNLESSRGLIFSQHVMLQLVERGLSREQAYAAVQQASMRVLDAGGTLADELWKMPAVRDVVSEQELREMFSLEPYLREIPGILARAGIAN